MIYEIVSYIPWIIDKCSLGFDQRDIRNAMNKANHIHFTWCIYLWSFLWWSIWGNKWSKCEPNFFSICFCFFFCFFLWNKTVHIKTSDIVCCDTQVFMWYGLFHKCGGEEVNTYYFFLSISQIIIHILCIVHLFCTIISALCSCFYYFIKSIDFIHNICDNVSVIATRLLFLQIHICDHIYS